MNSPVQQQQVKWTLKVLKIMSKGETNQSEIARILQVDRSIRSSRQKRISQDM
jgi:transcriptional regulator